MKSCDFCNGINKEVKIDVRTTMADDNLCDDRQCNGCHGCDSDNHYFTMIFGKDVLQVTYRQEMKDLIINPVSERLNINFCPMCGRKLKDK